MKEVGVWEAHFICYFGRKVGGSERMRSCTCVVCFCEGRRCGHRILPFLHLSNPLHVSRLSGVVSNVVRLRRSSVLLRPWRRILISHVHDQIDCHDSVVGCH